jgi:hypothetical protein
MVCLSISGSVQGFFLFIYVHISVGNEIIKTRTEVLKSNFRFHSATYACLSTHRTCISHVICHGLLYVQWFHLKIDCSFLFWYRWNCWILFFIKVITKLPNSEQSYKGKVKTHNYINRQNQSTTGKLWKP